MTCKPCTFLQEQEEVSLPTESLDIPLWLQSNGSHTLVKSLESEQQMDGFPDWLCGKGMLETLTHPSTPESWIAFMQDSLVKTLVSLENKQVYLKELDQVFTEKYCVLLASLDQDSYSWKMSQQLKATDLKRYSKTWPSWGMTQGGCAYAHPMLGRITTETDGSCLPNNQTFFHTPNTTGMDGGSNSGKALRKRLGILPTPTRHNGQEGGYPGEGRRQSPPLGWVLGGKINPQFTEWMMGWPIGYTALEQSETVKFHSKPQSPSASSVKD